MQNQKTILLIPEKIDIEFEQVFITWTKNNGEIKKLGKYWIKDESLINKKIAIYGNQTFALVLSQIYNVELISPNDKIIANLDMIWLKRNVEIKTITEINENHFPIFIKPVIPKLFLATIFKTLNDFKSATLGLNPLEEVIISSIVYDINAEARSFVKNGIIKDLAIYEGNGNLNEGKIFLQDFISKNSKILPEVVVIDIAYSEKLGWFILEFNACWGAGLNNCKAEKVIECIIEATKNKIFEL